jgi:hypothetical protein
MLARDIDTPALVVDLDILERATYPIASASPSTATVGQTIVFCGLPASSKHGQLADDENPRLRVR